MFTDLFDLFYPRLCTACDKPLLKGEETICLRCRYHLPETRFIDDNDNPVAKMFWGRINAVHASAWLYFQRGNSTQRLVHRMKYRGKPEIGKVIGSAMGEKLKQHPVAGQAELVLPVPLHRRKEKKRGYNQSLAIAEGIADRIGSRCEAHAVKRVRHSRTQTRKNRFLRWQNVETIFEVCGADKIRGKHVMLVDDVVTTGATLEACAQEILKVEGTKVSLVAMAYAVS